MNDNVKEFSNIIDGFKYFVNKYAKDEEKIEFKNQIKKSKKLVSKYKKRKNKD